MPYGYMSTFFDENKKHFDSLTRDTVNSVYTRFKKKTSEKSTAKGEPTINIIHIDQLMTAGNSSQKFRSH